MKSNKLIPSGHKNFFVFFVRTWDQNKFLSNPYQHALALWQKFCEVIIINYQKLIDKHVLKDKMQNEKQLLESCQTKFKTILSSQTIFNLFSNLANQWHHGVIRFIWCCFIYHNQIGQTSWKPCLSFLLQNRMIFNCLCYWSFQWFTTFSTWKVVIIIPSTRCSKERLKSVSDLYATMISW